jgi:capsular polysaccharide biosynthesis protein
VNQADIAVLNPAIAPLRHSSPSVKFNVVLAGFLGTLLGVAAGLLAEMRDKRLRRREDVSETLQVPVLALIKNKQPKKMGIQFKDFSRRFVKAA